MKVPELLLVKILQLDPVLQVANGRVRPAFKLKLDPEANVRLVAELLICPADSQITVPVTVVVLFVVLNLARLVPVTLMAPH